MKLLKFTDRETIDALKGGEVLSFPTETVFGLGVRYDDEKAFEKLVNVKRRPPEKPFTLMCASANDVEKYAFVDEHIKAVINKFMPGPITLLLKPKENLYPWVTLSSPTIGIRVPDFKKLQDLIKDVGVPLLVPSANKSGEPPCKNIDEVIGAFDSEIYGAVDGKVNGAFPSTIVSLVDGECKLIRQGDISFDTIKNVYKEKL